MKYWNRIVFYGYCLVQTGILSLAILRWDLAFGLLVGAQVCLSSLDWWWLIRTRLGCGFVKGIQRKFNVVECLYIAGYDKTDWDHLQILFKSYRSCQSAWKEFCLMWWQIYRGLIALVLGWYVNAMGAGLHADCFHSAFWAGLLAVSDLISIFHFRFMCAVVFFWYFGFLMQVLGLLKI